MTELANIMPGERVSVQTNSVKYEGVLLKSPDPKVIILKLDNGYNTGLRVGKDVKITKLGKRVSPSPAPTFKAATKGLPKISLITTGGTITSRVDYKTGAASSLTKPSELLATVGELAKIADFKVESPYSIWSEDMGPQDWSMLSKAVLKELRSSSEGVIVTQGTDILGYSSAALSFALGKLNKPVAIVAGQRSSDRGSFDGAQNLITGVYYAMSDINQVAVVMHGSESDDYSLALPGTKVRKMHTSRRDAFRPINSLPLAKIWPDGRIEKMYDKLIGDLENPKIKIGTRTKFSDKGTLIKFVPGQNPEVIDHYVHEGYRGIIIEATGLGAVPTNEQRPGCWLPAIRRAVKAGVFIGTAPQTLYGTLNPYVYSSGRSMLEAGVTPLKDILPETAYVKLSWALAQTKDLDELKGLMLANIAGEFSKREAPGEFLY